MQQLVWPNDWGIHYAKFGSIRDFLVAHAERYPQRMDGAFYRPEPRLRFGSAPLEFPSPGNSLLELKDDQPRSELCREGYSYLKAIEMFSYQSRH